jgi:polyvinyl alcohol dehydrogenase (cytochrome)
MRPVRPGWVLFGASQYEAMRKSSLLLLGMSLCAGAHGFAQEASQWGLSGHDLTNSHNQPAEVLIGSANAKLLTVKWVFNTGADVSATPTVSGHDVFFPDWAGNLFAVNRDTGQLIWSHKISDYNHFAGSISRSSPAIQGDEIILGDIEAKNPSRQGASLIAVDRRTGALRWITRVESHISAQITGSPVVFDGTVYVGVSSAEETFAFGGKRYPCCTFRGSVVAVDAQSGKIQWKTYLLPDNAGKPGGYSGAAVWQSPAIDPVRHQLYVGSGNNYSAPASVLKCQQQALANRNPAPNCDAPENHFDSAMALDLADGHIRWSRRLLAYDVWTAPCMVPSFKALCPSPAGPDYDLGGAGPNLLDGVVGFGQKSGIYWALDPDKGAILWRTQVGPGGGTGGIEWGTASDGRRIYAAVSNSDQKPYKLVPSGRQITWGAWSALDVSTGKLIWQTADPTSGAFDPGAVSVANGVMYAGSQSGLMYALDAASGKVLWSFASGGAVVGGPAIVDGVVYWGSGYRDSGATNNKLYAFSLKR